ncbi:4'-phosphopantetheinyl transferase family protein [Fulvimonas yonginensis]|uniref:4'-phosphopantetheinyl transferase superfamily protein n=1 Tax=Fulvimonas yonginensis TaxID=1495200 RepID=A0ABU8J7K7_9GAMM
MDAGLPAKVAEQLGDDEVHVWRLPYDPWQGRAPLLALLGAYLGMPPARLRLTAGSHGRPALSPPASLRFNWSHSGPLAVVALARGIEPGIDVERVRPRPRALEIARRFFAPAEAQALAALDAQAREAAFLRLWTAKEAVLKALGRGLAFGLHRLDVEDDPESPRLRRFDGETPAHWQLRRLALGADAVGALAWRGEPRRVRAWTLADAG